MSMSDWLCLTLWKLNPGSTVSYSAVWVYPLCTRLQGWPVLAFCTPQDRTGNLTINSVSMEMCVYIPQNVPKPERNWNFEISKNWPSQELNSGSPVYPCHLWSLTTRPLVDSLEHQKWIYKLDLTSSCQSSEGGFMLERFFSLITDTKNFFTKLSYSFSNFRNLHSEVFQGVLINLRVFFKSWNSILRKLLIYQYLYTYVLCYLWPYAMQ